MRFCICFELLCQQTAHCVFNENQVPYTKTCCQFAGFQKACLDRKSQPVFHMGMYGLEHRLRKSPSFNFYDFQNKLNQTKQLHNNISAVTDRYYKQTNLTTLFENNVLNKRIFENRVYLTTGLRQAFQHKKCLTNCQMLN